MQADMGDITQGFKVFRELLRRDAPAANLFVNINRCAAAIAGCFDGIPAFHTHAPRVW